MIASNRNDSCEMFQRLSFLMICFDILVLFCEAVNPACECVVYDVGQKIRGMFTSPSYPVHYSTNINCILYTFVGSASHIVHLTFLVFDLPVPVTARCAHFVRLFLDLERPEVSEQHRWNYELCGNLSMIQTEHFSSTSSLTMEFHTDHFQRNYSGFMGTFEFIDRAQFEIVGGNRRWDNRCIYDFHSSKGVRSGTFFSPRYPQNYPPNVNCQYIFYGTKNERVAIFFHDIQLETIHGGCHNSPDFIAVSDGLNASSQQLALFCNSLAKVKVTSKGNNLMVELVTDSKKQMKGFAAMFAFFDQNDGSPLDPPTPWIIDSTPSSSASGDGGSGRGAEVGVDYLGLEIGRTVNPGEGKYDLNARDSPDINASKPSDFEFRYLSWVSPSGSFLSIGFPDAYPASVRIRYVFIGRQDERIQIIFTELDLNFSPDPSNYLSMAFEPSFERCEEVDSVTLSAPVEGVLRDIGIFCGNRRPPMLMSPGSRLDVTLVSRSLTVSTRGFAAKYNFLTDFGIRSGEQDLSKRCEFTFRSTRTTNGTFTSPNFPGRYPLSTQCHYLFYGRERERVYITFPYFDVEGVYPGCLKASQSDYVEFSNFNIHLLDRKMNRLCGTKSDNAQKSVSSDGSFFRVTFNSNEAYDATGFEAFYQFRKFEELFSPAKPRPRFASGTTALSLTLILRCLSILSVL